MRLGVEGELRAGWTIAGGVAFESSPVSGATQDPAFPRGDALVWAAGVSYDFPQLSLDLGYSRHDYDDRGARGQELRAPEVRSRYSSREQVWALSARWRF
jgi:long-subunit fatty acid transport protein